MRAPPRNWLLCTALGGLALLLAFAISCGGGATHAPKPCVSPAQCAFGQTCYNGLCVRVVAPPQTDAGGVTPPPPPPGVPDQPTTPPPPPPTPDQGQPPQDNGGLIPPVQPQDGDPPPPPPSCGPGNCGQGCCDRSTGRCVSPQNHNFCGLGGIFCVDCLQSGTTCNTNVGRCQGAPPPPPCGPSTCTGCCHNGQCIAKEQLSAQYCGTSGGTCYNCQTAGNICDTATGQCKRPPQSCGPANCAGCCSNNQCVLPSQLSAQLCGRNGVQCSNCQTAGNICDTAIGQCKQKPPQGCGPANCAGCCFNNQCIQSLTDTACGKQGNLCANCQQVGNVCDKSNGTCKAAPPPQCGPSNCSGCCQGSQCVAGTSSSACGRSGAACRACTSSQHCQSGQCVNKPPQNSYPSGTQGYSQGSVMPDSISIKDCLGGSPETTKGVYSDGVTKAVLLTIHTGW